MPVGRLQDPRRTKAQWGRGTAGGGHHRATCPSCPGPHTSALLQAWRSLSSSSLSSSCSASHPGDRAPDPDSEPGSCRSPGSERPHQLLLQVYGPEDSVVAHGEDEEQEEGQLCVTHLPHSSIVKDRLPPVRKPVDQDVVVPADTHLRLSRDGGRALRGHMTLTLKMSGAEAL